MPESKDFHKQLPGILLAVCLLIAVAAFLIWPPQRIARTLYFPGTTDLTLTGERRLVPRADSHARDLHLVVEELILGPIEIKHGRLLPRNTSILGVSLQDAVVYVDLSSDLVFGEDEVRLGAAEGLAGVEKTLLYNFPWLEAVELTIGGQEPFAPSFRIPEDSAG